MTLTVRTSSRMFLLNSWPTRIARSDSSLTRVRVASSLSTPPRWKSSSVLSSSRFAVRVQTGPVDRREHLVEVAVQAQVGVELLDLLHRRLAPRSDGLEGVDLAEQGRHGRDVADRDADVVPPGQRVTGVGRRLLRRRDPAQGLVQSAGGSVGEPFLGCVDARQGQAAQLVGHSPQPMPGSLVGSPGQAIPAARHTGAGLAARAGVGGAVHERLPADRRAAARAGLALPPVDGQRPVEVAALAVDVDVERVEAVPPRPRASRITSRTWPSSSPRRAGSASSVGRAPCSRARHSASSA